MGSRDIKEMQMSKREEQDFVGSETDCGGRVPSVFPVPSLYPSFVHSPHFVASCLFSSLCQRRSSLNVCLKGFNSDLLLCCSWHMKPSVLIECLDKKTLDDPQRESVCMGDVPLKVFEESLHWDWSHSLRNDEYLKQTQVTGLKDWV